MIECKPLGMTLSVARASYWLEAAEKQVFLVQHVLSHESHKKSCTSSDTLSVADIPFASPYPLPWIQTADECRGEGPAELIAG